MNVRLKKEAQMIFWPWLVAALAGLLPLLDRLFMSLGVYSAQRLYYIASSIYVLSVVMLAAMLFGNEFQQRTFSLLFSQPCHRAQIWLEKLIVTAIAIGLLTLFHVAGGYLDPRVLPSYYQPLFGLLPFLFCAAMYWSLITRSALGGAVLSLTSLAALYLIAWLIQDEFLYLYRLSLELTKINVLLTRMSLIMAPVFLLLSWLRLRRLEITGNWDDAMEITSSTGKAKKSVIDFRSHANRPLLNLIFKELRLLRPILLMAVFFASLWLAAAISLSLRPGNPDVHITLINGLCGIYIPLVILLSGSLSFGEEKRLGTHILNLSSPISAKKQFLIKNIVATLIALSSTVLLITLLHGLTGKALNASMMKIFSGPLLGSMLVASLLVAVLVQISIWAGTVADRTVHALFLAIAAAIGFYALFHLALNNASPLVQPVLQGPVYSVMAHYQLSHTFASTGIWPILLGGIIIAATSFIVPAWRCFRQTNSEQQNIKKSLLFPFFAIALVGMATGALAKCLNFEGFRESFLYQETRDALLNLNAQDGNFSDRSSRYFTPAELVATGKLSPRTEAWLQNSTVKVNYGTSGGQRYSMALVIFPKNTWPQPIALNSEAEKDMSSYEATIQKGNEQKTSQGKP
ncbi:MAG TPA: ABC transporter permease subunit [Verrucomicrobiae bacterium]